MPDVLDLIGIDKAFGSHRVLRDVTLALPAGRVTVLMGANGAGKSTLVKILSGVHARDAGRVSLAGRPFAPRSPLAARSAGVVTVHQSIDDGVVPDLDIAANLMLEEMASGRGGFWYRRGRARDRAREIAGRMGLDFDLSRPVRELALADRQTVAIARAMAANPRVLILDEPTSSLSAREAERLFVLVERLRADGVSILYISHRMSDIERLADRIVVLRDGAVSGTFETRPLDTAAALEAMLGQATPSAGTGVRADARVRAGPDGHDDPGDPGLHLDALRLLPGSDPVTTRIGRGEIVAVTGLVGSGKGALAEIVAGLHRPAAGAMRLDGAPYAPSGIGDAIAHGVFLVPRDRAGNAVVPAFDIAANLSLPFTARRSRAGFLSRAAERGVATALIERLGIVCRSPRDGIGTLSGGNQQKVMIARWLSEPSRVLVLDEPFQGVDIRARRDIGARLRDEAVERATLVLVSEIDEALEIADRILVMANHTLVGEHRNRDVDLPGLMRQIATPPATERHAA